MKRNWSSLFLTILLTIGSFIPQLLGQKTTEMSLFDLDLTASELDVYQSIGISLPGLPYSEALSQAEAIAKTWLSIGAKTNVSYLSKKNIDDKQSEQDSNFPSFNTDAIRLISNDYTFPKATKQIVKFEDGTVLVVMNGYRTVSIKANVEKQILGKYYFEEQINSGATNISMAFTFGFKVENSRNVIFEASKENDTMKFSHIGYLEKNIIHLSNQNIKRQIGYQIKLTQLILL